MTRLGTVASPNVSTTMKPLFHPLPGLRRMIAGSADLAGQAAFGAVAAIVAQPRVRKLIERLDALVGLDVRQRLAAHLLERARTFRITDISLLESLSR